MTTGDRLKYCVGVDPQTFGQRMYQFNCGLNLGLMTRVKGEKPFLGAILQLLNHARLKYETANSKINIVILY